LFERRLVTDRAAARSLRRMECLSCQNNDQLDWAPPRERIAFDPFWRVAHAIDSSLPGWLVLVPRRHVLAVADLSDDEAAGLGTWLVRLSRALQSITGCDKTYIVQMAEKPGFAHVHFHVIPRMADAPAELTGPGIFAHLQAGAAPPISANDMDALALRLRADLQDDLVS